MAPPPPEFQFMNISNIEDANTRQNRSTIRSHITKRQHRLAKQKKTKGGSSRDDPEGSSDALFEPEFLPVRLSSSIADHSSVIGRPTNSSRRKKRPPNARTAAAAAVADADQQVILRNSGGPTANPRRMPKIPPHPNNGKADPFDCYPVPYQPWFDPVLHHMMTVYAPRGWPALAITPAQGLAWERYMTQQALSEPALFYVRLLFASGDMIRLALLPRATATWLQYQAVRALNDALGDPGRAASDAVILAVGRIAWHESLYGDRAACTHLHRPAQARLIAARGGFDQLDFPPLVKRLMCLTDEIMARQSGSQRYFALPPPSSASLPASPPEKDGGGSGRKVVEEEVAAEEDEDEEAQTEFTARQKRDVLDSWVPPEAQTPTPAFTPTGSVAGSSRSGSGSGSGMTTPGSAAGESYTTVGTVATAASAASSDGAGASAATM